MEGYNIWELKNRLSDLWNDYNFEHLSKIVINEFTKRGYHVKIKNATYSWDIVEFKIEEAPDWLFGINWIEPEWDNRLYGLVECKDMQEFLDQVYLESYVFAQYEPEIDKFKFSRSVFCETFAFRFNDETQEREFVWVPDLKSTFKTFDFIVKEPALAFCREYYDWDYNKEYHTREEAETAFKEYLHHKNLK